MHTGLVVFTGICASLCLCPALAQASSLPVCHGGNRAARHVTCIVDGDTGWENGVKWRYLAIDAPEMPKHAECKAEGKRAIQSRDRLRELMAGGYTINWSGDKGRYGRQLVTVTLADGRDAGNVLLSEHLAQPWPNRGNVWCDGSD
jgi:endonuclease YncB( thermonuclease family)